jgi:acyl transferase domain-containing protein
MLRGLMPLFRYFPTGSRTNGPAAAGIALLLEMTLEAFEQAVIPPSSMRRGPLRRLYQPLEHRLSLTRHADDLGAVDGTTMTGSASTIAANRLSYVFDLHAPSMIIRRVRERR